ncbi:Phage protein [Lachnospiraceae bacterium TWA4]|nr:Phage protein [Lachnospiraceae bacterium TWA4]
MATNTIPIDELARTVMDGLKEYATVATEDVKQAVKKTAKETKKSIQANAPKNTGAYKKSWTMKTTKETSNSLQVTIHSKNRYQLTHLLEFGHAKRKGGRTRAFPHIAPAEQEAIHRLEEEIRKALQ